MAEFKKIKTASLTDSAVQVLITKILSGELEIGSFLPPERNLAEMLGISRSSLHQAILELEYLGFVSIVPRRGTIVSDYRKFPTPQSLSVIMSYGSLKLDRALFDDMMDLRIWLESECARRACVNIYEKTYNEMLDIIDSLTEPEADIAKLLYSFHYKLTLASGNSLYSMIYRGFEQMLVASMKRHYDLRHDDIAEAAQMRRELMNYIKNNQPDEAADCVCRIIRQGISVIEEIYNIDDK